jgi:hypothetical protein
MAWSDAARAAAAQARRLRSNLSRLPKRDRLKGRKAVFSKLRAEAGMDRIVRTGGVITYTDPHMRSRTKALSTIAKLQRLADYKGPRQGGGTRTQRLFGRR